MQKLLLLLIVPFLSFGQIVTEDCNSIPDPGICLAYIQTFYFDQTTSQCEESFWGGCGGVVPFWTLEGCQNSCENNSFIPELATNHVLLKNYSVVGVHWGASLGRDPSSFKRQMSSVLELAAKGEVDPLLHPTYTFDSSNKALQDIADRKVIGKVVVDLAKS